VRKKMDCEKEVEWMWIGSGMESGMDVEVESEWE